MKKILLVRDYSGMGSHIAAGLRTAGNDVTLASISDSFKGNYGCDINLEARVVGNKLVDQYLNYLRLVAKNQHYDIVHLQTQLLAGPYSAVMLPVVRMLRARAKLLSVSLAGDDWQYWDKGEQRMEYSPHAEAVRVDLNGRRPYYSSRMSRMVCAYTESLADKLIPACYDYAVCHQPNPKLTRHVPFLFDVENTPYRQLEDGAQRKLRIFHAVSRKGFKGSHFIVEALELCRRLYPNQLDIAVLERIPYQEYKKRLAECDIFIDQCNTYSYGMAAVEALALGKVVLSGAEPAALDYMDAPDCPVVNIKPDPAAIAARIGEILADPASLSVLSARGRAYAQRFHSYQNALVKLKEAWDWND